MGICDSRTVIITGAAGGLGKSYALAFAAEGANVVVNDIGTSLGGEGRDTSAADAVVDEIRTAGGNAIANYEDVTDWDAGKRIVDAAVEAFGDLHVVVNNAGIVRDRMFVSATLDEWDATMHVHLRGHFCIARHAVDYWRGRSKEGHEIDARIINTTSGAGLQGSIAQAAYSTAKGGIASLTLVQAAELGRYGITANAIAPSARTGMTMGVPEMAERMAAPDDNSFDHFAPENVSVLLAWLGSEESSHVTGRVFESEGGRICIADGWRTTEGVDKGAQWKPAEIGAAMDELLKKETPAQKVWGI